MARLKAPANQRTEISVTTKSYSHGQDKRLATSDSTESQQMLALRPVLKKTKVSDNRIQQFRAEVVYDQQKFNDVLREKSRHAQEKDAKYRDEIVSLLARGLHASNEDTKSSTKTIAFYPGTRISSGSGFEKATRLLQMTQSVLAGYETMNNQTAGQIVKKQEAFMQTWQDKMQEAEASIHVGHRTALRRIKRVLSADETLDADHEGTSDRQEHQPDICKTLGYAERGVKRLVKALSPNDVGK